SDSYARAFAAGFSNTLRAALPAVVLATVLGFAIGIAQMSGHVLLRTLARAYVDTVRNISLLVQCLLWYSAWTELLPGSDAPLHLGASVFLSKAGAAFPTPELSTPQLLMALVITVALPWLARRAKRRRLVAQVAAWLAVGAAWLAIPSGWERPEVAA